MPPLGKEVVLIEDDEVVVIEDDEVMVIEAGPRGKFWQLRPLISIIALSQIAFFLPSSRQA